MPYWSGPLVLVFCWCNEFLIRPGWDKKRYPVTLISVSPSPVSTDQHAPVNNTKSWIARMIEATILNCWEEWGNHIQWHDEQLIYGLLETLPSQLSIKLSTRSAIWISYYVHVDDSKICYVFIVLALLATWFYEFFIAVLSKQERGRILDEVTPVNDAVLIICSHFWLLIGWLWLIKASDWLIRPGVFVHCKIIWKALTKLLIHSLLPFGI